MIPHAIDNKIQNTYYKLHTESKKLGAEYTHKVVYKLQSLCMCVFVCSSSLTYSTSLVCY